MRDIHCDAGRSVIWARGRAPFRRWGAPCTVINSRRADLIFSVARNRLAIRANGIRLRLVFRIPVIRAGTSVISANLARFRGHQVPGVPLNRYALILTHLCKGRRDYHQIALTRRIDCFFYAATHSPRMEGVCWDIQISARRTSTRRAATMFPTEESRQRTRRDRSQYPPPNPPLSSPPAPSRLLRSFRLLS